MAEEVKSPNPPMTFKSSFWGFNRDEVLNCIDALAAVTGRISSQEVLNTIFSRFCIGK